MLVSPQHLRPPCLGVDDRKRAKQKAQENMLEQTSIFDNPIVGIIHFDDRGVVQRANAAAEVMFGYDKDELKEKNVSTLLEGNELEADGSIVQTSCLARERDTFSKVRESSGLRKDGSQFPLEFSYRSFDVEGVRMFTAIMRDMTKKKRLEEKENNARAQFEVAVTGALDAIIVINESGDVVEFNPAAEHIFGHLRGDVIGKNMGNLIVPENYREAHKVGMQRYIETGFGPVLNKRIEIKALHASGREFDVELAITTMESDDGKIFIGYLRDITQRLRSASDLVEAKERAEIASKAKSSFLAMMSHEIRTPLNGVIGILGMLQDSGLGNEQKKLLRTGRQSGRALLGIINDILDFSKLEAGKFELEEIPFHPSNLLEIVSSLVQSHAAGKKITFSYEIGDDVPQVLIGDPDRIRQIILNLAWNAVKFTPSGFIRLKIEKLDKAELPPWYRFSVTDSGIGISKEKQGDLFAEFSTLDASYSRKFGGTGLGLAICKSLVDAMGGRIDLISEHGKGSTFWFDLALRRGAENSVTEDADETLPEISDVANARILVAEDNRTNQLVVTAMLERMGCLVDVVADGAEALRSISQCRYDAILMDVSMPELDGIETTRIIRARHGEVASVPIIGLTAYALDEDREKVLAAGMNDFVAKPISRTALYRAVVRQIKNKDMVVEPSAPSQELTNVLDVRKLRSVLGDLDPELRTGILDLFRADVEKYASMLAAAVEASDSVAFEKASHGIIGVAGMFGANELAKVAEEANALVRRSQNDRAYELHSVITKSSQRVLEALENSKNEVLADRAEGDENEMPA